MSTACGATDQHLQADGGGLTVDTNGNDAGAMEVSREVLPPQSICDGTHDVRFSVRVLGGRPAAFTGTLYDLGSDFLFIDGGCRYWVSKPTDRGDDLAIWREYRTGSVSPADLAWIESSVDYGRAFPGSSCLRTGAADAGYLEFWDGNRALYCGGDTDIRPSSDVRERLWTSGAPVTGAVRIEVGQVMRPALDGRQYDWPLMESPASFSVPYAKASDTGVSFLIDDSKDAAAFRALRARVIKDAEATPGYFYGLAYLSDGASAVVIRDDLPFTRKADGLWVIEAMRQ